MNDGSSATGVLTDLAVAKLRIERDADERHELHELAILTAN